MIKKFSQYLAKHSFQRHMFFFCVAIIAIAVNGYHFGTFDQVFHITFLKKFVNPSLYPGDPFLSLRWFHFSYFWFPFIPLFKAELLEISMFIIHILTIYGTIWMFWDLSNLLFNNNMANLLLSIALIFPHLGLPGFQIIEFSLLNRTFILPFLLGSILLYLRGKKYLAFLLLGLMFNLHVIYSLFVLCMFLMNENFIFRRKMWWKPILQLFIFTLAGLPVLVWRIQTGSGIDFSLDPEMLELASRGLLYTVYFPIGNSAVSIGNFLAGLGTAWAFFLGYQHAPKSSIHQSMRNFVLAIGTLILVALFTSYILQVTILIQMQILRAGVFLLYFGMLYLGYYLTDLWQKKELSSGGYLILSLSLILLITPLITILLRYLLRYRPKLEKNLPFFLLFVTGLFILTIIISSRTGLWSPGFHITGPDSHWRDIQEWAKRNTSQDSTFITPPHLFGHYIPDWRVFSERTTVATIPEMMEIPFDPDFSDSFKHRFESVAPGAIDSFNGNYLRSLEITKSAFYTNGTDDFADIACQFSADFLVVEEDQPREFEVIYQNPGFILYKLPGCP